MSEKQKYQDQKKEVWTLETIMDTTKKEKIPQSSKEAMDYFNIALKDNDPKICEKIEQESIRNECKENVQYQNIIQKQDISACAWLKRLSLARSCETTLIKMSAQKQKNTQICKAITDKSLQDQCRHTTIKTILRESTLSPDQKYAVCGSESGSTLCQEYISLTNTKKLFDEAIKKNDPTLCAEIQDNKQKYSCNDAVSLRLAVREKDAKICEYIKNLTLKETCLTNTRKP